MSQQTQRQGSEARGIQSRRSVLDEVERRKELKKVDTATAITEKRIREGDERVVRLTRAVILEAQEAMRPQLHEAVKDVAAQRDILKSCQTQRALTEAEIESLTPAPEQKAIRQHEQEQLRGQVSKRLEKDRQADQLLKELSSGFART